LAAQALGVVGRRASLRLPADVLRLGLGEMSELLLCGQNAVPAKALRSGYVFRHPGLAGALRQLVG
jgi:NAD dependent epimerase/dehydratase family enzyme